MDLHSTCFVCLSTALKGACDMLIFAFHHLSLPRGTGHAHASASHSGGVRELSQKSDPEGGEYCDIQCIDAQSPKVPGWP